VLPETKELYAGAITGAILCSGKVYYDLVAHREKEGIETIAVLRLEQLYPFPKDQILALLAQYPKLRELRWVQEEPENMGAYRFVHWTLNRDLPEGLAFGHVARDESGSPATGSATIHQQEHDEILVAAFRDL